MVYFFIKYTFINLFSISVISGYSFSKNHSLVILKQIFSYIVAVNWNLLTVKMTHFCDILQSMRHKSDILHQSNWHSCKIIHTVKVIQLWHIKHSQYDTGVTYYSQSDTEVTYYTIKVTQSWNISQSDTGIDKVVKYYIQSKWHRYWQSCTVAVNWNLLQSKWHIFVTFYTVNVTQEWRITPVKVIQLWNNTHSQSDKVMNHFHINVQCIYNINKKQILKYQIKILLAVLNFI